MNGISICSGIGGLELGLKLALGDSYRCILYIEREGYAAATLVARMDDKAMDSAPIYDDLTTFDGRPWRGKVDIISGGFPCQPASTAGRRKGTEDERWLWPIIKERIREIRPRLVFLENVPGLLSVNSGRAFGEILWDLAELGYDAEWDLFSASGVGAPHQRKRVFILAQLRMADSERPRWDGLHERGESRYVETDLGGRGVGEACGSSQGTVASMAQPIDGPEPAVRQAGESRARSERARSKSSGDSGGVADAERPRIQVSPPSTTDGTDRGTTPSAGAELADAKDPIRRTESEGKRRDGTGPVGDGDDTRLEGRLQPKREEPDELPPWPPGPTDLDSWREVLKRWPEFEPAIRRMASRSSNRVDRLRALGNAVVPACAALAFLSLAKRAGIIPGE